MANVGDFKDASFQYSGVKDGESYSVGGDGPEIKVLHSPGHTPGSTSYIIDDKYFITGDTVFILSVGRPDFGGKAEEWSVMLFDTLTNKVQNLDKKLNVLPGHFIDWNEANDSLLFVENLGEVIHRNAGVFKISTPENFTKYIKDNMRKSPEIYGEIRKVNVGWLDVDMNEADIMDLGKNECVAAVYEERKG